ncbi:MAG: hypothetical protein K2M46_05210 [Lachnospiraceae bacterium]|nr:hypothetical protein [Lachnospiraceae bacterium]
MKKTYIISFLLFLALAAGASYMTGYYMSRDEENQQESEHIEDTQRTAVETDKYTSDQTVYILESYDLQQNQLTEEKLPMPAEYVGCTREEMLEKIKAYAQSPSQSDLQKGLCDFTMVCFSSNKLVLRKTYKDSQVAMGYQVKLDGEGNIIVYYTDSGEIYTETDISYSSLPPEIQVQVDAGVQLDGLKEVFDFLENYSS